MCHCWCSHIISELLGDTVPTGDVIRCPVRCEDEHEWGICTEKYCDSRHNLRYHLGIRLYNNEKRWHSWIRISANQTDIGNEYPLNTSESESESDLLHDWRFTANQFVSAKSSLRLTTSNFFLQLNTCGYNPYVTSSLTRGWVCRLQLLLILASAVILTSESCWTHDHILLSQIRDSPNLEGQVPVFISPQEQGDPVIPPGTGFTFVAFYESQGYGGGIRPCLHTFCSILLNTSSDGFRYIDSDVKSKNYANVSSATSRNLYF
jgi:hypothetical protein